MHRYSSSTRTLAPVLLALGFLAACQAAADPDVPETPTGEPSPQTSDGSPTGRPVYYLVAAGGERIAGQIASWCWAETCVDLEAPPQIESFHIMPDDGTITLALDPPLPEKLVLSLRTAQAPGDQIAGTEIEPDGLEVAWKPEAPPADYVLAAYGSYEGGSADVSYYFGVKRVNGPQTVIAAPPALHLEAAGESLAEGLTGSYCWPGEPQDGQQAAICVDAIWPPVHAEFTALPGGEPLRLRFAEDPAARVELRLFDAAQVYADHAAEPVATMTFDPLPDPLEWLPDVPAGDYLLHVLAWWAEGGKDAAYSFSVRIP